MLMALGQFAFEIGTLPYLELSRRYEWRHAESARFGAIPASQFCGPAAEPVRMSGVVLPGLAGRHSALETVRQMGEGGEAHVLVDGQGRVHGGFVILSIDVTTSEFIDTGEARKADFTIELRRVS